MAKWAAEYKRVKDYYGIRVAGATRLGGYSNCNLLITGNGGRQYVLRISRSNRSLASVQAEEHVLRHLQQQGMATVPVLLPLQKAMPQDVQPWLHLFERLPGKTAYLWWQQCSEAHLVQIFEQLPVLHQAMQRIPPLPGYAPATYCAQLPEEAPGILAATATGRYVMANWPRFLRAARALETKMQQQFNWKQASWQWIHGDVHLENVLFENDRLTALLDFEFVRWDACEKDLVFSAFRVCKTGKLDDRLRYNREQLEQALAVYRSVNPSLQADFFTCLDSLWKPYFCLDQCMTYLLSAFDGLWELVEGIGFLPCFNEVLHFTG